MVSGIDGVGDRWCLSNDDSARSDQAPAHNGATNRHRARVSLTAPAGPRFVATGRAQRNPWAACADSFCPGRGSGTLKRRIRACDQRARLKSRSCARGRLKRRLLLRPAGADVIALISTGCAALHPWLPSDAPAGAKRREVDMHVERPQLHAPTVHPNGSPEQRPGFEPAEADQAL